MIERWTTTDIEDIGEQQKVWAYLGRLIHKSVSVKPNGDVVTVISEHLRH
jgi:hypothetical protein